MGLETPFLLFLSFILIFALIGLSFRHLLSRTVLPFPLLLKRQSTDDFPWKFKSKKHKYIFGILFIVLVITFIAFLFVFFQYIFNYESSPFRLMIFPLTLMVIMATIAIFHCTYTLWMS